MIIAIGIGIDKNGFEVITKEPKPDSGFVENTDGEILTNTDGSNLENTNA